MLRGDRLRATREKAGMSQRELARVCGVGEVMIYRYESGITDPSTKYLTLIADKLSISTDYLVGLSDEPNGHLKDKQITDDERIMIDMYRREGWSGVARLSIEKMSER